MQWLFPLVAALHNGEEAIFMPNWVSAHQGELPFHPAAGAILSGLLLLTVAALAVAILSVRSGKQSVWTYLLFGYAAAMLINVFCPPPSRDNSLSPIHAWRYHRDYGEPTLHERFPVHRCT